MLKLETPWDDDEEEDDEEPLRTHARYCSPITATVMVTVTSVCSATWIG